MTESSPSPVVPGVEGKKKRRKDKKKKTIRKKASEESASSQQQEHAEQQQQPPLKKKKKRKRPSSSSASSSSTPLLSTATPAVSVSPTTTLPKYPYPTDFCDHFETPFQAYQDLEPVLFSLARALGKAKHSLRIYDPYYCKGAVVERLASLGFAKENVINRMQDFYKDIREKRLPEKYDVIVTNPPYSEDHKVFFL